jgi:hypothetical protein
MFRSKARLIRCAWITEDREEAKKRGGLMGPEPFHTSDRTFEVWHRLPATRLRLRIAGCSYGNHSDLERVAGCPAPPYSLSALFEEHRNCGVTSPNLARSLCRQIGNRCRVLR